MEITIEWQFKKLLIGVDWETISLEHVLICLHLLFWRIYFRWPHKRYNNAILPDSLLLRVAMLFSNGIEGFGEYYFPSVDIKDHVVWVLAAYNLADFVPSPKPVVKSKINELDDIPF